MVWQIQLPYVIHYICHVSAHTVAMMNQLQLPCVYPKCQNAAWQQPKKTVGHGASKSTCHVITPQLPSQVRTPRKEYDWDKIQTTKDVDTKNRKDMTSVPCTIGSANLTAFLPSTIGCAIIAGMPPGKAKATGKGSCTTG